MLRLVTLGPSKAESNQAERGKVFTLAIMFTLGCIDCHVSEVRCAAHVYGNVWGAIRKNIISDRFSTKTAISTHI